MCELAMPDGFPATSTILAQWSLQSGALAPQLQLELDLWIQQFLHGVGKYSLAHTFAQKLFHLLSGHDASRVPNCVTTSTLGNSSVHDLLGSVTQNCSMDGMTNRISLVCYTLRKPMGCSLGVSL